LSLSDLSIRDHLARGRTAHPDTFVRDNLPPAADWPTLDCFGLDTGALSYPAQLNCASELLDRHVRDGHGDRPALYASNRWISYAELLAWANRIAATLQADLGLLPGNRVLLRGYNSPWMIAAWLGVLKAGGVVVATMPLLRARELGHLLDRAKVHLALCDARLADEMRQAAERADHPVRVVFEQPDGGPDTLGALCANKSGGFLNVQTAADDPCLIAFTSGTTGTPKGAVHAHRDVLAICDTFSAHVLRPSPTDVFAGSPPLAFTYGLGGLLTFPFRVGAATALLETVTPAALLQLIDEAGVTTLFTSPTMYRSLLDQLRERPVPASLRACVSAGEPLPLVTFQAWEQATGLRIIDGIGATEMLHIFISAAGSEIVPGATGKVVPGYEARVVDEQGQPVPDGQVGLLAVRGPTGCRYLADPERQRQYVRDGWNFSGDAYVRDERGYFWFQARADDMIISAGYNIAGPEIENVLLEHPKVKECGVVGAPDPARGHIVKAYIVLRDAADATPATVEELQQFVKSEIAPYKYPRAIEFVDQLPRTETGKLQRFKLRQEASSRAAGA
jgi:2-aminobenzoate-CoA ligase